MTSSNTSNLRALAAMDSLVQDFRRLLQSEPYKSHGLRTVDLNLAYQTFFRRNLPALINFGCRNSDAFVRLLCANHPELFRRGGDAIFAEIVPEGPENEKQQQQVTDRLGSWKVTGDKAVPFLKLGSLETDEEFSRRVEILKNMEEMKINAQILEMPRNNNDDEERRRRLRSLEYGESSQEIAAVAVVEDDKNAQQHATSIEFAETIRQMDLTLLNCAFEVTLTSIRSLDRFYCQFVGMSNAEALKRLETSMQDFYEADTDGGDDPAGDERLTKAVSIEGEAWRLPPITLLAHRYRGKHGTSWRRAMVLGSCGGTKHDVCLVLHIDYGTEAEGKSQDLKHLLRYFMEQLPAQAARCHLAKVQPPAGRDGWSRAAQRKFFKFVSKDFRGKLIGLVLDTFILSVQGPGLILYAGDVDQLPDLGRCINKELVDEGFADGEEDFVFPEKVKSTVGDNIKWIRRNNRENKGAVVAAPTAVVLSPGDGDGK